MPEMPAPTISTSKCCTAGLASIRWSVSVPDIALSLSIACSKLKSVRPPDVDLDQRSRTGWVLRASGDRGFLGDEALPVLHVGKEFGA